MTDIDIPGLLAQSVVCAVETQRFRLEPLTQADAHDLLVHFGSEKVTRFLDIDPLDDLEDARAVAYWAESLRAAGTGVRWAIRNHAGGFVGTCGFHLITTDRGRRAEIGYDLGSDHWGRGVMDEVMPTALAFGHDLLGLRRIEALVTPGNVHSRRLLLRHGFRQEGRLRDYGYWRGRFWDQWIFSRLADDPGRS